MKKTWNIPTLTVHGSVEAITEKTTAKTLGLGDDLTSITETNEKYGDKGKLS